MRSKLMPNGWPPPNVEHVHMVRVTHTIGIGDEGEPVRHVHSYYHDGIHIFTVDPLAVEISERDAPEGPKNAK